MLVVFIVQNAVVTESENHCIGLFLWPSILSESDQKQIEMKNNSESNSQFGCFCNRSSRSPSSDMRGLELPEEEMSFAISITYKNASAPRSQYSHIEVTAQEEIAKTAVNMVISMNLLPVQRSWSCAIYNSLCLSKASLSIQILRWLTFW